MDNALLLKEYVSVTYRKEMKRITFLMYWEGQDSFEQNHAQITRERKDSVVTCVKKYFVFQIGLRHSNASYQFSL